MENNLNLNLEDSNFEFLLIEAKKCLIDLTTASFNKAEDDYLSILCNLEIGNNVEAFEGIQKFQIIVDVMKDSIRSILMATDEYDEVDDIDFRDDPCDLLNPEDIINDEEINLN